MAIRRCLGYQLKNQAKQFTRPGVHISVKTITRIKKRTLQRGRKRLADFRELSPERIAARASVVTNVLKEILESTVRRLPFRAHV